MINTIPRQLPKGVDAEKIESQASSASGVMNAMMFVQLILQMFMKGAMDELWSLFFALQLVCYIKIYDITVPGNAEIYIEQFTNVIEFKALNPKGFAKMIDPDFDLDKFLSGLKGEVVVSADQEASIVNDMQIYIMAAGAGVIILCCMFVMWTFCTRVEKKIVEKIKAFRVKFFWNGFIRSLLISYIKSLMTAAVQIKLFINGSEYLNNTEFVIGVTLFTLNTGFAIWSGFFLEKKRVYLDSWTFRAKFETMYNDIHLTRNKWTIYFNQLFLLRRSFFVGIPMLISLPFAQL